MIGSLEKSVKSDWLNLFADKNHTHQAPYHHFNCFRCDFVNPFLLSLSKLL